MTHHHLIDAGFLANKHDVAWLHVCLSLVRALDCREESSAIERCPHCVDDHLMFTSLQQNTFPQHVHTYTTCRKVSDNSIVCVPVHMIYMPMHTFYVILAIPFFGMDKALLGYSALRAEGGDNSSVLSYCPGAHTEPYAYTCVCIHAIFF